MIEDLSVQIYEKAIERKKKAIVYNNFSVDDKQIEAWQKMPKEQALREALELFKSLGMDITERRLKFDVLKFMAELQGALQPTITQSMHVVSIEVVTPEKQQDCNIINITPIEQVNE